MLDSSYLKGTVSGTAAFEPVCRCAVCGLETLSIRVYDIPCTKSMVDKDAKREKHRRNDVGNDAKGGRKVERSDS